MIETFHILAEEESDVEKVSTGCNRYHSTFVSRLKKKSDFSETLRFFLKPVAGLYTDTVVAHLANQQC